MYVFVWVCKRNHKMILCINRTWAVLRVWPLQFGPSLTTCTAALAHAFLPAYVWVGVAMCVYACVYMCVCVCDRECTVYTGTHVKCVRVWILVRPVQLPTDWVFSREKGSNAYLMCVPVAGLQWASRSVAAHYVLVSLNLQPNLCPCKLHFTASLA